MLLKLINLFVTFLICSNVVMGQKNGPDEKIPYDTTSQRKLFLHVFYPKGHEVGQKRTVVVHFFGGGWCTGNASQFYPQCRYLASKGYVAISADYRIKKIDGVTPFDCVDDARKAIRFIRMNYDKFGIDPEKLVASGGSAGGHVALSTAVFKRKSTETVSAIPNALILYNPVLDTTKDGYGFNMFDGNELLLSPNHNLCSGLPPTLIFHGMKDRTVPYNNALKFEALMNTFGNKCKLVSFENADHGFFNINKKNGDAAYKRCMEEVTLFMHEIGFSPEKKLSSNMYQIIRDSLKNSISKFKEGKTARVAFIGGSITEGKGWRDSVCIYLQEKYPNTKFEFINAGLSAQGATSAAFRLQRDVLSKGKIDLAFVESSVNDRMPALKCYTPDRIKSMEGVIRHLREANGETDIIMMHFADQFKMADYSMGKIPQEIMDYETVAKHYKVSSINLAKEVNDRIMNNEFSWEKDFKDIHPSPFGQFLYSNSIRGFLERMSSTGLSDKKSIEVHVLPAKLDSLCYNSGAFIGSKKAYSVKGFEYKPLKKGGKQLFFQSENVGDSFKLDFEGSAVGMVVYSGPDAGMIEYSIDGKPFKRFDLYTVNSWVYYVPRYYILCNNLDAEKKHTLVVRVVKQYNGYSNGNRCIIKEFYVNK